MATKKIFHFFSFLLLIFCFQLQASNWEPSQTISGGGSSSVKLCCDAHGNVAAVWQQGGPSQIMSSYRPAGGAWEPATLLSAVASDTYSDPQICCDGNGVLTAIFLKEELMIFSRPACFKLVSLELCRFSFIRESLLPPNWLNTLSPKIWWWIDTAFVDSIVLLGFFVMFFSILE